LFQINERESSRRYQPAAIGRIDKPCWICEDNAYHAGNRISEWMIMSESKVRSFFDRYAVAFTALDVAGILSHFAFPCQIATETSGYAFADRAAIEADMTGFVDFYAQHDFERAELARLDYQPLSDAFGLAHVNWRLVQTNGETLVDVESTYILRVAAAEPAIIGILGHNEDTQWKQKGAPAA
jgi:hypothetical protein